MPKKVSYARSKEFYTIVGDARNGFAVLANGVIEYDLIKTRDAAEAIKRLLNEGFGPEWNKLAPRLEKEGIRVDFM